MEKLTSFEVAPFFGLMNMLKANYLEKPEIFKMILALLTDYTSTEEISLDMVSRYLRILLSKNADLAECLITFLQPSTVSSKSCLVSEASTSTEKDTKQEQSQTVKKPASEQYTPNLTQSKLKQSPVSAFIRPAKLPATASSATSTVATLYPTLRSSLIRGTVNRTAIPAQFSPFLYQGYFPMMGAPVAWMTHPAGYLQSMAGTEEALDLTKHNSPPASGTTDQSDSKEIDHPKTKTSDDSISEEKSVQKNSHGLEDQACGDNFPVVFPSSINSSFNPSLVTSPAEYARVIYQNQSQNLGSGGIPYRIVDNATEVYLGTARNLTSFPYFQRMILPDGQMKTIAFDSDLSHQLQSNQPEASLEQAHYPQPRERSAPTVAKIKPKPVPESSTSSTPPATSSSSSTCAVLTRAAHNLEAKSNQNKVRKRPIRTVVQIGLKDKVKKHSKSTGTYGNE